MPSAATPLELSANQGHDPVQELLLFLEQTLRLVSVSHALVASSRHVDLEGLQDRVGLVCAKALDLPPGRTGLAKVELQRLASGLAGLHEAMRENSA